MCGDDVGGDNSDDVGGGREDEKGVETQLVKLSCGMEQDGQG